MMVLDTVKRDVRLAWRGVRARGWQALLIVGLLGAALGANTVLFAAADAFVFNRAPYPNAGRLVSIARHARRGPSADQFLPATIKEWRRQTDLFDAVHAYMVVPSVYLSANGVTEPMSVMAVTPGLFEMLGALPAWGRALSVEDTAKGARPVALIAEDLAIKLFGSAPAAIGRELPVTDRAVIVGVMRDDFRFPTGVERIWRPLDLDAVRYMARNLARLRPGVPFDRALAGVEARMTKVNAVDARFGSVPVTLRLFAAAENARSTRLFMALTTAGWLLLLIACANVASLELAAAVRSRRLSAIQAALGAGRSALIRQRIIEGGILLVLSVIAGCVVFVVGSKALNATLPVRMSQDIANAVDFDARAACAMLTSVAAAWVVTALPALVRMLKLELAETLRDDTISAVGSAAGARARKILVVAQVAATVVLAIGASLYARTYAARSALDKGFDSDRIATIELLGANGPTRSAEPARAVLESHPVVDAWSRTSNLIPDTTGGVTAQLRINGRPAGPVKLTNYAVEPSYFATLGIPIVAGRLFDASESASSVIVDAAFARRYWGAASPINTTFDLEGSGFNGISVFTVIGIAQNVRVEAERTDRNHPLHVVYYAIADQPTSRFVARLRRHDALPTLVTALHARLPDTAIRADLVDARYAQLEGDRRLAAGTAIVLSSLALGISMLGIYAVVSFLVSTRAREIAIRIALGAGRHQIRTTVLKSACGLAATGLLIGIWAAWVLAPSIESQLFGVSSRDLATYVLAAVSVLTAAATAGWLPARRAARVDPAVTLRRQA